MAKVFDLIQQRFGFDAIQIAQMQKAYPKIKFDYLGKLLEQSFEKGVIKTSAELVTVLELLEKEKEFDSKLAFIYLPRAVGFGLAKSVEDMKALTEIKANRNEVIAALSEATRTGYFRRELLHLALGSISAGTINYRLFESLPLFRRNPTVKKYKKILAKGRLNEKDMADVFLVFRRFERVSQIAKKYTWKNHPRVGRIAFLEAERLLEPQNPDWAHKSGFTKPKYFPSTRDSIAPVNVNLRMNPEGETVNITDSQEVNWLSKQFNLAKMNQKADVVTLVNTLSYLGIRPTEQVEKILRSHRQIGQDASRDIVVNYLKAHPEKARKILITCMPIVTRGYTLNHNMNLRGVESLSYVFATLVPKFISQNGLSLPNPFASEAQRLVSLTKKYSSASTEGVKVKIRLSPGKTFLDAQPGATGENCYILTEKIKNPRYHIVQIVDMEKGTNEGTMHIYERKINGERAFVLAGIEAKQRLVRRTREGELYRTLLTGVERLALSRGVNHVYSTMDTHDISNRKEISGRVQAAHIAKIRRAIKMHGAKHKALYLLSGHRK